MSKQPSAFARVVDDQFRIRLAGHPSFRSSRSSSGTATGPRTTADSAGATTRAGTADAVCIARSQRRSPTAVEQQFAQEDA